MSISLQKGGKFNLSKREPGLKKIMMGLGWEMRSGGSSMDLDASIFMVGSNAKLPADEYFIFYNNLKSPDGALQHTGDNRTGIGDDDDEMILANLGLVNPSVEEIIVVISIHEAHERRQHFGMLKDAYIRLVNVENNREVLRYNLGEQSPEHTDMEFGRLRRENNDWHFVASGIGSNKGLQGYVDIYA